ncbi:flagellar P-ring protein FlgI [Jannaschia pagri]|uniref:Flagellar P-ring protein FlgI n=1 Tax=Jannaschia pagri TaxID=2829797 RepID=A0ABQ4NM26_9RHOB|nr:MULTISPECIES: hypothetical protein [unclassified Jannaschia]GIT91635.1 flagellar P-ring protein FlgI [Jannaschia sp. AI_61]GIT95469.1 flagellar P-ring protein FlgI [Jannaschia sp. AI_62]
MNFLLTQGKRLVFGAVFTLLLVSALARVISASLSAQPAEPPVENLQETAALLCPPSEEVANLLRQIAARDAELDAREARVALREQDTRIATQEIRRSLEDLTQAEERLAARMYQSNEASETDVARLTEVYEGMKPKDAAVLFETMESNFAAGFLARMRPDAAAAIFSNLSPEKAYALSVVMAGRNANAATGG